MTTAPTNHEMAAYAPRLMQMQPQKSDEPFVEIPQSQRFFMGACVTAYATLVVILGLIEPSRLEQRLLLLFSSISLIFVAAFPLLFKFKSHGFLHPLVITSALAILNMVIRQTDVLSRGLEYHFGLRGLSENALSELVVFVNVVAIIAFLAKYAGFFVFGSASFSMLKLNKNPNALFLPLLLLWIFLGVLSMALLMQASGGIQYHLKNMNRGHEARIFTGDTTLLGTYAFIIQSTIVTPILYAAFVKNGHKSIIFFGLVVVVAAMAYLTAGRRSSLLPPTFFAIAIFIYKERKLPLVRIAVVGFLLFLFLSVGSLWRQANRSSTSAINWNFLQGYSVSDLAEKSLEELSDRSGNAAPIYPIVVQVPKRYPFNYFKSYAENFYRFIPRAIWPDKPRGIGIECAEVFYNRFDQGGIPPGPYGEAYWSLGIFGVIAVYFFFGGILRVFSNVFSANPKSLGIVAIYLLTVMRLGPDQISFRVWIFTLVPLILFLFVTNLISFKGR